MPLALRVERIVDNELPVEDVVVAQTKGTETERHPAQAFTRRVRVRGMGISGADNFTEQQ